ncbi:MAG: redoxin domain-containing protein [Stenotrophomonas bentonitica]|jgi:thiol-disulfide isomerase/thioredoxin
MISSVGPVPLAVVWVLVGLAIAMLVASVVRAPAIEGVPRPRSLVVDMLLLGLLAGRAAFVIWHLGDYAQDPWGVLRIGDGGFLVWPAMVAGLGWGAWRLRRWPSLRRPVVAAALAGVLSWAGLSTGAGWLQQSRVTLPAISLTSLQGEPIALADTQGTPVVVNLWASWCGPCRREMPVLARAQQRHPDIRFLFVNQGETREEVEGFIAAEQLTLDNVLLDEAALTAERLQVHAYPTTLFFDGQGRLQQIHLGELSAAGLQSKLDSL